MVEPPEEASSFVDLFKNCQTHPKADVAIFCESCKKGLCSECASSHPTGHITFNLLALGNALSEQLKLTEVAASTYQEVVEEYEKLEGTVFEVASDYKNKVAGICDFVAKEVKDWLMEYALPVEQLMADIKKKRVAAQNVLQSLMYVKQAKPIIQEEIEEALRTKQYFKIYTRKKAMAAACVTESQLVALKEKALALLKRQATAIVPEVDVELIKTSVQKTVEKLRTAHGRSGISPGVIFNIAPKGARIEVLDILHKRRTEATLGLNIEGYDAVLIGTQLYVIGGMDPQGEHLKSCIAFNVTRAEACQGVVKAEMHVARVAHTVVDVCRKYIYCLGGYNPSAKYLKLCEKFAVHLNRWMKVPNLNEHKAQVAACLIENRYLYSFGGNIGASKWYKTIELLDVDRECDGWKVVQYENKDERWTGSYCSGCAAIANAEVLLFGGLQHDKLKSCFLFTRTAIIELDKTLETSASFYQRKPRYLNGIIYAPSSHNDIHIASGEPAWTWQKSRVSELFP